MRQHVQVSAQLTRVDQLLLCSFPSLLLGDLLLYIGDLFVSQSAELGRGGRDGVGG